MKKGPERHPRFVAECRRKWLNTEKEEDGGAPSSSRFRSCNEDLPAL